MTSKIEHGMHGYEKHGCRCDICREANTQKTRRLRRIRNASLIPADVVHGASCYNNWGCRCDICTAGNTKRRRDHRARLRAAQVTP